MSLKQVTKVTKFICSLFVVVLLVLLMPGTKPQAAGRTYVPQQVLEDKKLRNSKTETCRLARLDRNADEDKNICVYRRQSGGTFNFELENSVHCVREIQCPITKNE